MATTKILPVRKRLKDCLDYAANPKKTEVFRGDALDRLMHYTQNEDKTEHQLYVTGFNCDPQNACLIMEATKRRWHKEVGHGNVGYHIIQSFKPGEASPDQVHQIGCEFARRCLEDRFECTVSTHLDKGHLHNHIVVNSVSFMDGKMFRNDFKTYYQGIRQISDDLCRQNRLSVIETDGRGISYGEWRNRHEGKPTLRGMVKADVEMALAESSDFDDFVGKLQRMGYEVKYGPRVKHMAVRHQASKKFVRLEGIAPQFSELELRDFFTQIKKLPPEMQQEYQAENQPVPQGWQKAPAPPAVRRARCRSRLNRPYKKVGGIMACYYHYCALLRRSYRGKSGRRCYYLLREDFSKFNRYRRQCDLLWKQKIESTEELLTYKTKLTHELEVLTQKRKYMYTHGTCKSQSEFFHECHLPFLCFMIPLPAPPWRREHPIHTGRGILREWNRRRCGFPRGSSGSAGHCGYRSRTGPGHRPGPVSCSARWGYGTGTGCGIPPRRRNRRPE